MTVLLHSRRRRMQESMVTVDVCAEKGREHIAVQLPVMNMTFLFQAISQLNSKKRPSIEVCNSAD